MQIVLQHAIGYFRVGTHIYVYDEHGEIAKNIYRTVRWIKIYSIQGFHPFPGLLIVLCLIRHDPDIARFQISMTPSNTPLIHSPFKIFLVLVLREYGQQPGLENSTKIAKSFKGSAL